MSECRDCLYFDYRTSGDVCKKKKKKVDSFAIACSSFVSDSVHCCIECYYCEGKQNAFKEWYVCKKTGKKLSGDASDIPACMYFMS